MREAVIVAVRYFAGYRIGVVVSIVASCFLSGCISPVVRTSDWPQWRGPDRSGVSADAIRPVAWPPAELWRSQVGEGYSSVAIAGGRVCTVGWTDGRDTVHCLDAETGLSLWEYSYPCGMVDYNGPRATPTFAGDEVYTLSHEGRLCCLDAASGRVLWEKLIESGRPRWGFAGSPLVLGEKIILNAGGAGMAVDRRPPHDVLWQSEGVAAYASPVAFGWESRVIAVLFSQAGLVGVDAETGRELWWHLQSGSFNVPDPVVFKGMLFLSCGRDTPCRLLRAEDDRLVTVWANDNLQGECATAVVVDGYLYGFDDGNRLCCVDIRDGSLIWSNDELDLYEGSLIAAGGRLIVLDDDGKLAIIGVSSAGCDTGGRSSFRVAADMPEQQWPTAPALSGGRLYCRSREGLLVCLRIRGLSGPQLSGDAR